MCKLIAAHAPGSLAQINELAVVSGNTILSREPGTATRSIDALSVLRKPLADLEHAFGLRRIDLPIGTRPDVEQHIAIPSCGSGQQLNQLRQRLHFRIRVEAPCAFGNRGAQLPWMLVVEDAERAIALAGAEVRRRVGAVRVISNAGRRSGGRWRDR